MKQFMFERHSRFGSAYIRELSSSVIKTNNKIDICNCTFIENTHKEYGRYSEVWYGIENSASNHSLLFQYYTTSQY